VCVCIYIYLYIYIYKYFSFFKLKSIYFPLFVRNILQTNVALFLSIVTRRIPAEAKNGEGMASVMIYTRSDLTVLICGPAVGKRKLFRMPSSLISERAM